MVTNTKIWEHLNQWNNFTAKSPWFRQADKYRGNSGDQLAGYMLEKVDIMFRSIDQGSIRRVKISHSWNDKCMEWNISTYNSIKIQAKRHEFTTLPRSKLRHADFSIKDLPQTSYLWNARIAVAVSTVKFGWLKWQLQVLLSYQYLPLVNQQN